MSKDERLTGPQVARRLEITPGTWRGYRLRGIAPEPDGVEELTGTPWWLASSVDAWNRQRPGQGARTDLSAT